MIEIKELSFGYNPKQMLYNNLNLNMEGGRIYGLLGKNGAGKSTFLRNIAGLLFPTSGKILVNGDEPRNRNVNFLQDLYFLPEDVYMPHISVLEFVSLYSPFYPNFNQSAFYQHLKDLEVDSKKKLNKMSLGNQKKAMIAFSLACETDLLMMDEPKNGLDIPSKKQFKKLMVSAMSDEKLFIISTHYPNDLESLIDWLIIIEKNEIVLHESIERISEKLIFKTVDDIEPYKDVILYEEKTLKGKTIVAQNIYNEETRVNFEHLFNAVIANPNEIKMIFNSK